MSALVVDASLVIRLLINHHDDEVLRQRLRPPRALHAPALLDAEVASGVRGLLLGSKVKPKRAAEMIADFEALSITRHPMQPFMGRVIELRHNVSAYDAFYLALAEALQAPLLTRDAKFAGATAHDAEIQLHP